jgi:hypothetical protein
MVKLRMMIYAGHVERTAKRNACRVLAGKARMKEITRKAQT